MLLIRGILNCILDTSKIEAGKMQLEEQVFDVEQLLEDVVDLYYPAGMNKGVDVILDPCDGSVSRCRWAIDDQVVQVVIHELVRAYDECRAANLDWTNCAHHACNEYLLEHIRANHLSGYCHLKQELLRGHLKIKKILSQY
ncbi:mitochondrial inner membrane protease ATP23-like [Salvia miltiorrhiza]|uniref:mitochondrial inner membrane protease ATP23-like n=1 Tax=Salvia miltiorrhiza TaxID=226208 RepID=UPI0025AD1F6D|nr:mitochondrial inner membrane protease ATP23-like [Salvia miltiorrhiza]XP_057778335.1 mitochondrial inner membrane protease ATP23-like [Salvia miltiorrhiza]XP_057778336.1 mitochondrial inner membrane protease ATP23-like [Salvia miltiorrhiza]XP_057778337.1 mitochondrial inner membrane protease ATP23-like [Salvia miltiorrhiza]XP_057809875.1 mitochondrial inner membrane protease ATP23-like [Salvia miltiorrhiza]XP_057809883.1 mitochondrial inner membrane protease ATP23-like [Salvia miltiorrhiza]